MKSWHIQRRGGIEQLKWGDFPEPNSNGVKIQVLGAALNPADWKVLIGTSMGKFLHSNRLPIHFGYDFSGKTTSGEDVYGFLPYAPSNKQGTFSEWINSNPSHFAKKPGNLSHADAASLPTVAVTALLALRDTARLKKGQRVLINGASGGIGTAAVQIAKIFGAHITAVASKEKLDFLKDLGADVVIDYRSTALKDITSTFDFVLDVASNSSFSVCKKLLNPEGTYTTLLPSSGMAWGFLQSLFGKKRLRFVSAKSNRGDLEQITQWVQAGLLKPVVEQQFHVSELPRALELFASGKSKGKITISMEKF